MRAKNSDGSFKYLAEVDLRKLYKERGIDINEIDSKVDLYRLKEKDILLKIGELLTKNPSENDIKAYKEEVENIRTSINTLIIERTGLLDISIDQQMLVFVYSYFAYLLTDKLIEEKWIKAWNSFDEFLVDDEKLVNQAGMYSTLLINDQFIANAIK